MGVEIERRFLIDSRGEKPWRLVAEGKRELFQCYLSDVILENDSILWNGVELVKENKDYSEIKTWRLRRENDSVWLTAKGKRTGATATEYEWEISLALFESLQGIAELPFTQKTRWLWRGEDQLLWEIDEFSSKLSGLIIAEVELESEEQEVIIPSWAGMELTHMNGWSNASLAMMIKDVEMY